MTPRDNHHSDLDEARQNRRRDPVTRDTAAGQRDKDLTPGDTDDKPTQAANESRYAAAPAAVRPLHDLRVELPQHDPILSPAVARALLRLVQRAAAGRDQTDDRQPPPPGSSA
ncbi:MAG TPA: hypothetical protein VJT72_16745 [Pseudonocardiaceae bacterium]|nr:hypothetical protein [Pseudonocardiaceae bacterium]